MKTKFHQEYEKTLSKVYCRDCGCVISTKSTRFGRAAIKVGNPRCGPCYLKHKSAMRKAKGVL